MTSKTLGAYQRHEKAIADRGGDVLTLSTGHPSARTDEVTVHVREHFRGRTNSAAVHVTPRDLRAALDEFDPVRECPDLDAHWRLDEAQETIQRLTQERDEARADLAEYVLAQALRTQPRPLTADDITDEMVRRGAQAATPAGVRYLRPHEVLEVLTAALTEPTRPEGAEDWEDWLIHNLDHESLTDQQIEDLANRVAQRVIEEQP